MCIIIFTVEFIARLCVCPSFSLFAFNFLNIVDAISIIPWYIEKALVSNLSLNSAVFRSLRLIRVFRLLKVSRYLTFMNSLAEAMLQSIQPLYILLFIILIGLLIFSSAIFYAERGVRQSGTSADQFGSIIQSMWWCVATITTVGYGALWRCVRGSFVCEIAAYVGFETGTICLYCLRFCVLSIFATDASVRIMFCLPNDFCRLFLNVVFLSCLRSSLRRRPRSFLGLWQADCRRLLVFWHSRHFRSDFGRHDELSPGV